MDIGEANVQFPAVAEKPHAITLSYDQLLEKGKTIPNFNTAWRKDIFTGILLSVFFPIGIMYVLYCCVCDRRNTNPVVIFWPFMRRAVQQSAKPSTQVPEADHDSNNNSLTSGYQSQVPPPVPADSEFSEQEAKIVAAYEEYTRLKSLLESDPANFNYPESSLAESATDSAEGSSESPMLQRKSPPKSPSRQPTSKEEYTAMLNGQKIEYESCMPLCLQEVRCIGDGNCLFRAIAYSIYVDENKYNEVKRALMNFIYNLYAVDKGKSNFEALRQNACKMADFFAGKKADIFSVEEQKVISECMAKSVYCQDKMDALANSHIVEKYNEVFSNAPCENCISASGMDIYGQMCRLQCVIRDSRDSIDGVFVAEIDSNDRRIREIVCGKICPHITCANKELECILGLDNDHGMPEGFNKLAEYLHSYLTTLIWAQFMMKEGFWGSMDRIGSLVAMTFDMAVVSYVDGKFSSYHIPQAGKPNDALIINFINGNHYNAVRFVDVA
jgi:hypothetical protein